MSKLLFILVVFVAAGATGCVETTTRGWHQQITTDPPVNAQASHEIDPDTGLPFAEPSFPRPLSREMAFRVLLNTSTFAEAYVGYVQRKSLEVEAFQVLLTQPDAKAVFTDLFDRAKTAGKLYALCAYYLIAPEAYTAAEQRLLLSAGTVDRLAGCVMSLGRPVREIVRSSAGYSDISGGKFPRRFRDAR